AQIALTPRGEPRLLLIQLTARPDGGFLPGHLYRYGECSSQCADAQRWQFTTVLTSKSGGGLSEADYTYRNFALDPQGRPRFVYQDRANSSGAHRGSWYVFCDADCGTHSEENPRWYETCIDNPDDGYNLYITERTVLAFSPDGHPWLLTGIDPVQYVECNVRCDASESWPRAASLLNTGSGSSAYTWSLAVDDQGRPRATIFPRGGPFYCAWCDANCTDAAGWAGTTLDVGSDSGQYSALVLDGQGSPRVAYRHGVANIGYAWCDSACESEHAQWRYQVAEESDAIGADLSVPLLPHCLRGGWFGGLRPTLALDRASNPRIAYDAEFMMECRRYPNDPTNQQTFIETKWWTSRLLYFPQPSVR
ncbi:MAG: hypothetical protein H7Y32_09630, partial [Chloroflexales bacterium]|nr:hypothetical protein [Chloroflexales bacterium]